MTFKVVAFYQFVPLPDCRALRAPLHALCLRLGLRGTILLAGEGINGTVAGPEVGVAGLIEELATGPLFCGRLDGLEPRYADAATLPFRRMKVRLRDEIVTLGDSSADPRRRVGTYVEPAAWNALLDDPEVLVVDTRNRFEVAMGSFAGAVDSGLGAFGDFPGFAAAIHPRRHGRIALFCTGGIRCEKATSYLLGQGFEAVFHLRGGILNYLETVPEEQSRWTGTCFVFDDRVGLGHGLVPAENPVDA